MCETSDVADVTIVQVMNLVVNEAINVVWKAVHEVTSKQNPH